MSPTTYTTRVIPTTSYVWRPSITTNYATRQWIQSDLWYLITQLWILCDNSWNRIKFHTWTFYNTNTEYTTRSII